MGTWQALKDQHFTPAEQASFMAEAEAMGLPELRSQRRLSQEAVGQLLGMKQASVSKLERQTDMYVSSLRRLVQALGGDMKIVASFPDGDVLLDQFSDLVAHTAPEPQAPKPKAPRVRRAPA